MTGSSSSHGENVWHHPSVNSWEHAKMPGTPTVSQPLCLLSSSTPPQGTDLSPRNSEYSCLSWTADGKSCLLCGPSRQQLFLPFGTRIRWDRGEILLNLKTGDLLFPAFALTSTNHVYGFSSLQDSFSFHHLQNISTSVRGEQGAISITFLQMRDYAIADGKVPLFPQVAQTGEGKVGIIARVYVNLIFFFF